MVRYLNGYAAESSTAYEDAFAAHLHAVELAERAAVHRGESNPSAVIAADARLQDYLRGLQPAPALTDDDRPSIRTAVDALRRAARVLQQRADRGALRRNARVLRTATVALVLFAAVAALAIWTPWAPGPVKASAVAQSLKNTLRSATWDRAVPGEVTDVDCDATPGARAPGPAPPNLTYGHRARRPQRTARSLHRPAGRPPRATRAATRPARCSSANSATGSRKRVFARLVAASAAVIAEQTGHKTAAELIRAGAVQANGLVRVPSDLPPSGSSSTPSPLPGSLALQLEG